jgi:hypothetical protein
MILCRESWGRPETPQRERERQREQMASGMPLGQRKRALLRHGPTTAQRRMEHSDRQERPAPAPRRYIADNGISVRLAPVEPSCVHRTPDS